MPFPTLTSSPRLKPGGGRQHRHTKKLKKDTKKRSGAGGNRTRDLFVANETLYQLSYNPDAPPLDRARRA